MGKTDDANAIYAALEKRILATIRTETKSCLRSCVATVTTAATTLNNGTVGVTEAYDTERFYPYYGTVGNIPVGQSVMLIWAYNDKSTAFAWVPPIITNGTTLPTFGRENEIFKQYSV